jgi:hypothetical protein
LACEGGVGLDKIYVSEDTVAGFADEDTATGFAKGLTF